MRIDLERYAKGAVTMGPRRTCRVHAPGLLGTMPVLFFASIMGNPLFKAIVFVLLATLLSIIAGYMLLAILGKYRSNHGAIDLRKARELSPGEYDPAKLRRYKDSLEALCLGRGIEQPPIFVLDPPIPLAYVTDSDDGRGIAITGDQLEAGFTYYEAEAIVAVLLARLFLDRNILDDADQVTLSEEMRKELRYAPREFFRELIPFRGRVWQIDREFILLADTEAIRETGEPDALRSAIVKSYELLNAGAAEVRSLDISAVNMMFVEPRVADLLGRTRNQRRILFEERLESIDEIMNTTRA
ncbi:MAG: hypothetical protein V1748_03775 [Actinomycetota bacterium]